MYFTYAENNRTFQSVGVWNTDTANVTGLAEPEQVRVVDVSDGVLQALDVPPSVGRWLSAADQVPSGPDASDAQLRLLAAAVCRRPHRRLGELFRLIRGHWRLLGSCRVDFVLSTQTSI